MKLNRLSKVMLLAIVVSGLAFTAGCCTCVKSGKKQCLVKNPTHRATIPAHKLGEQWWYDRVLKVNEKVAKGNIELIMLGDSITDWWEEHHKANYDKFFGKWNNVDEGFAGDQTQHVLWRLNNGHLDGISPKVVVLMIGTNNSNGNDFTAEEIADGITAIVCKLRTELPKTKILMLAIFPRGEGPSIQREKNALASELASNLADNKHVFYMDINDEFLDENQILSRDIMPDHLHPNDKGYDIWGNAMMPKLNELMAD